MIPMQRIGLFHLSGTAAPSGDGGSAPAEKSAGTFGSLLAAARNLLAGRSGQTSTTEAPEAIGASTLPLPPAMSGTHVAPEETEAPDRTETEAHAEDAVPPATTPSNTPLPLVVPDARPLHVPGTAPVPQDHREDHAPPDGEALPAPAHAPNRQPANVQESVLSSPKNAAPDAAGTPNETPARAFPATEPTRRSLYVPAGTTAHIAAGATTAPTTSAMPTTPTGRATEQTTPDLRTSSVRQPDAPPRPAPPPATSSEAPGPEHTAPASQETASIPDQARTHSPGAPDVPTATPARDVARPLPASVAPTARESDGAPPANATGTTQPVVRSAWPEPPATAHRFPLEAGIAAKTRTTEQAAPEGAATPLRPEEPAERAPGEMRTMAAPGPVAPDRPPEPAPNPSGTYLAPARSDVQPDAAAMEVSASFFEPGSAASSEETALPVDAAATTAPPPEGEPEQPVRNTVRDAGRAEGKTFTPAARDAAISVPTQDTDSGMNRRHGEAKHRTPAGIAAPEKAREPARFEPPVHGAVPAAVGTEPTPGEPATLEVAEPVPPAPATPAEPGAVTNIDAPPVPEKASGGGASVPAPAPERAAAPRDPLSPAWLRQVFAQSARAFSGEDGWKVLEMQLEDGQGTMTVRARREEDHMAVSVGFSDPSLRAMAMANTDRLQQALQTQYATHVDLSLFGGEPGSSDRHQPAHRNDGSASGNRTGTPTDTTEPARPSRPIPAGTRNEWIG